MIACSTYNTVTTKQLYTVDINPHVPKDVTQYHYMYIEAHWTVPLTVKVFSTHIILV